MSTGNLLCLKLTLPGEHVRQKVDSYLPLCYKYLHFGDTQNVPVNPWTHTRLKPYMYLGS